MSTEQTDRLSALQELVVDGVPVFHLPGPSRTSASLCFGVGLQHETYGTVGVTHLVAGLVAAQMPKAVLEAGVSVEVDHTRFTARGRPEEVAGFLRRVCRALVDLSRADLPLEHLEREKKVLVTEGTASADLTMATCWTARYGYEGLGLSSTNGYGPLALTEDDVRAHLARHFTAGSAALAVLGPLPDDLSLPLPRGGIESSTPSAPGTRLWPPPRLGDGPEWVQSPAPAVGLLLDGLDRDAGAVVVASGVLRERLQDVAREQRGLTYSVASDLRDGPDGDLLTLRLDFREGRGAEVAALVWQELTALAADGPTQAELDHVLAVLASGYDPADDDAAEGEPLRRAVVTAIGARLRTPAELAADVAATTRDDVRDVLARAHRRALLVLPDGEWLPDEAEQVAPITERWWCAVAEQMPPGRQLRPPLWERAFKKIARRSLVLTDESIAERDETGTVHEVRWDEVVALAELPAAPGVVVLGRDLCPIGVHPDVWGRETFEEVLRRLAPHAVRLRRVQRAEGREPCPG